MENSALKKMILEHGLYPVIEAIGETCHEIADDTYKKDQKTADGWNLAGHKIQRFVKEEKFS